MKKQGGKGPLSGLMASFEAERGKHSGGESTESKKGGGQHEPSHFDARINAATKAKQPPVEGKPVEMVARRWVDPKSCRMWEKHNRRYDLLNEERCSELIADIKLNGQQFPAIVRELHGDPDGKLYEVICGARRHWTAGFIGKEFYVEVRQMSDQESFVLSDSENRSREDISDYERALDYDKALKEYYSTQAQMAAALEVKKVWLSEFLALAQMPVEIVDAYVSVIHIKAAHAAKLRPLLEDKKKREAIFARAAKIKGAGKAGATVYKELLAAGRTSERGRGGTFINEPYKAKSGKVAFRFKCTPRGGTQLVFEKDADVSMEELESLVVRSLRERFK